ncbi:MAG: hypothetical protein K2J49_10340, partial [Muribaculaceae bacterium]|nr:hypothetical protein [Muribaculaceae bacterium]
RASRESGYKKLLLSANLENKSSADIGTPARSNILTTDILRLNVSNSDFMIYQDLDRKVNSQRRRTMSPFPKKDIEHQIYKKI